MAPPRPKSGSTSGKSDRTPSQSSLAERAARQIVESIELRVLKPGEVLDFAALSEAMNISRTPIRESVRKLQMDGLLEGLPGGQFRVVVLTPEKINDYYVVRTELEIAAAGLAARQILDEELDMLKCNLELFRDHIDRPDDLVRLDQQFHEIIYDATRNRYLRKRLSALRVILGLLPVASYHDPQRTKGILKEHKAIVATLARHDAEAAQAAIRTHIEKAGVARAVADAET